MISALIGLIVLLVQIVNFALLVYCVLSFVMPQSDIFRKAQGYVEPVLRPFRALLYKYFPKLQGAALDLSPLAVWLALQIAVWLLNLLRRVF